MICVVFTFPDDFAYHFPIGKLVCHRFQMVDFSHCSGTELIKLASWLEKSLAQLVFYKV
jgi:hypothetical protein